MESWRFRDQLEKRSIEVETVTPKVTTITFGKLPQ